MTTARRGGQELVLTVKADAEGVGELMSRVRATLQSWSIPDEAAHEVLIITDELATNIARHAWHDGGEHSFAYTLRLATPSSGPELNILLQDDGDAFDLTQHIPTGLDQEIDDRRLGGIGLALVREFAKQIQYSRENGENRVCIVKSLA
jgi:anti-sigma regulatory factor (Ser/Thr protein kinase)